jgi:hypothetical protein
MIEQSAAWTAMSVEHGINEAFFFQEQPKLYAEKVLSLEDAKIMCA